MRRYLASGIAALLLLAPLAGCGGDEATELEPADVRANLEEAGYVVEEDVTDGANKALPPDGEIDADLYFGVDSDPEQQPLYAGVYFFSDPADAATVAEAFSDSLNEVRDTRLYNLAGDDQAQLDALVETGEGE